MDFNEAVGLAVQALRRHKGLTQKDFLGTVSIQYLSDLERGKRTLSLAVLARICERLEVHEALPLILAKHFMQPADPLLQTIRDIERQLYMAGFIDNPLSW
ncbi:helix-turn-helix domain-containing protein [Pseudomonas viridiflava]|jgi:transcriptional regulator with XRE-family HTH domain|uniref:helix-turn-helix domain-containing protein n=1 Tax=Pseudomonas viridiflava TaxID=33069 RepID=UPI000F037002|nr:helix-turn-helix transcriptional regulator [Pseudomonas viridiflava]MDY0938315.1 helix-turn-helix transcriptional regulator [Pseudomonas viridiflava]MDY1015408.1 helix-turn-helix transcriptional regulator [Pseudomonas viridiflava]